MRVRQPLAHIGHLPAETAIDWPAVPIGCRLPRCRRHCRGLRTTARGFARGRWRARLARCSTAIEAPLEAETEAPFAAEPASRRTEAAARPPTYQVSSKHPRSAQAPVPVPEPMPAIAPERAPCRSTPGCSPPHQQKANCSKASHSPAPRGRPGQGVAVRCCPTRCRSTTRCRPRLPRGWTRLRRWTRSPRPQISMWTVATAATRRRIDAPPPRLRRARQTPPRRAPSRPSAPIAVRRENRAHALRRTDRRRAMRIAVSAVRATEDPGHPRNRRPAPSAPHERKQPGHAAAAPRAQHAAQRRPMRSARARRSEDRT